MGIKGYLQRPSVRSTVFQTYDLDTAIAHVKAQASEPLSVVLVDGDNFRHIWTASLQSNAKKLPDRVIRREDFIKTCRDRASSTFQYKVQEVLSELSKHFEAVYVIWGNPELEPIAKATTHAQRRDEKAAQRSIFIEELGDYISNDTYSHSYQDRRNLEARFIDAHCGLPPLPTDIINEARLGFFARLPKQGIVHVLSRDESDVSIARAELDVPNAVVYSSDGDLVATLNCFIIRQLGKTKMEVVKGRRSAKEMAMAALVGNEYTSGEGCPGIDWSNVEEAVDAAIHSLQAMEVTLPDAVAICKEVLEKQSRLSKEDEASIIASVKVWEQRSHGHSVQPRIPPPVSTGAQLRSQAPAISRQKRESLGSMPSLLPSTNNLVEMGQRPRRSYAGNALRLVLENI